MAARSTRRKIKDHGERIIGCLHEVIGHLRSMEELANGGSEYIDSYIPVLVQSVVYLEDIMVKFAQGL